MAMESAHSEEDPLPHLSFRQRSRVLRRAGLTAAVVLAVVGGAQLAGSATASGGRTPARSYASKAAIVQSALMKKLRVSVARASSTRKKPKPQPQPAPQPAPPPPPPSPPPPPPPTSSQEQFGVSPDNLEFEDAATRDRTLDSLQAMGAHWIRFDVKWDVIQYGGPNAWDFSRYDALTAAARARGMEVLGTLAYAPRWARSDACRDSFSCEPRDANEYARFAEATVAHFNGRISHWELWNEPNISAFWKPSPNTARYASLVRAAYPRIKAANPDALVLAGATSPAPNDGTQIDEVTFLQQVYANGGRGHFDAWSHHPYTHPAPPGNVHPDCAWYQIYGTQTSIRSLMTANGDGAKKVWGTEYGPPSAGTPGSVSEGTQAQWVTDAYRLWRSYDWAGPLFWYSDRDEQPSGASTLAWNYYGLLRHDFSHKPAWDAYRASAST
jgi:polysaccharide biosynthesis protein PslG